MKNRWPTSMHSQTEAVFHSVRSIGMAKSDTTLGIRSFGSWERYKGYVHSFVTVMIRKGRTTILDTLSVQNDMTGYLEERLAHYVEKKRSRQTMETILSALGKFEYAINCYIEMHVPGNPRLNTENLRMEFYTRSRNLLRKSSKIFENRAYPDPIRLIEAITEGSFQLQASLQYEGGLRAEGVGAPSNRRLKNPLTKDGLRGIGIDPVVGIAVGIVASVEKGGKETEHYISVGSYRRLEEHIARYTKLESDYFVYVEAINKAAKATGQYAPGRGSHGFKHNFAQERYLELLSTHKKGWT